MEQRVADTRREGPQRGTFASLQVVRGAAAVMVVVAHGVRSEPNAASPARLPTFFDNLGFAGVDLFFCLSGLIMYHVHAEGVGRTGEAVRFLWRRFSRIYPLYWLALAVWVSVQIAVFGPKVHLPTDWKTWLLDFWLLPRPGTPILPPAWTLRHEMRFYAIFAVLLTLPPRLAFKLALGVTVISSAWLGMEGIRTDWPPHGGVLAVLGFLFHPTNLEFAAGALVSHAMRAGWLNDRRWAVALPLGIIGLLLSCRFYDDSHPGIHDARLLWFGGPAALVLWGLAVWEVAGRAHLPRWMVWPGDISYALYLLHQPVVLCLFPLVAHLWGGDWAGYVALGVVLPASVAVAGLVHHGFERPVLNWCRRVAVPDRSHRQ